MKISISSLATAAAAVFMVAASPLDVPKVTGSTTPPKPAAAPPAPAPAAIDRISQIRARGHLRCGVNGQSPGFSMPNSSGRMEGFDADFCRAMAAAILGKPDAVQFKNYNSATRFPALAAGEIDVLSRNTTATFTRDTELNVYFGPPVYFDGQGIMVSPKTAAISAMELADKRICGQANSTGAKNFSAFFGQRNIPVVLVDKKDNDDMINALKKGDCDGITTDASQLVTIRLNDPELKDFIILPEYLSKEPLAPAVAKGDERLATLLRWTVHALMQAEELGVMQSNFARLANSGNADIGYFLGTRPGVGKGLGLDDKWISNVIESVGNYGEMFDRHLGKNSPFKIARGPNKSWMHGGLQYPIPFR
jgi:general L-amino acid transport system substrate-binding protein